MNMKIKTLAALMLGGSLVACGGSSNDGEVASDPREGEDVTCVDNPFQDKCIILPRVTEIDITNEPVPLHETFAVQGDGNQAGQFFSTDYKSLNTALENDQYEDDYPSFYYPTCCFWETDEATGEPTGNLIEDLDERLFVGTDAEGVGYLAMSSSRWTVAQLQPDLVTDAESDDNDAKSKTTDAPVASSWGELDLSVPYRVSFCLKDSGRAGVGTGGNLELYVDNNSGGNQGQSIHGNQSLLLRTAVLDLEAGNRLVVDVPGDVRVQNNDGEEVNLLGTTAEVYGTEISFLQFRVSSGGYAVISDLMVEHQSNLASSYMPCVADDTLFEPEALSGVAYAGLPHSVNFNVSEEDFFGGGESASFVAFPDSLTTPFYAPISGGSRTLLEDGTIRFGNAYWSIGNRGGDTTSDDTVDDLTGGLDLSEPYRVTVQIDSLTNPEEADAQLQVFVDNSTSGSSNSVWGGNSRLVQFDHQELATGELVINVPGDVTLNGTVVGTVDEHVGSERSFLMFRCPGNCGNAEEGNDLGIAFSGLVIEKQDVAPAYIQEDFSAVDAEGFFSAAYKTAPNHNDIPLYGVTSGESRIVVENGTLTMNNARFTVGSLDNEVETAPGVAPNGALDLSRPFRVRFTVLEFESVDEADPGQLHVYLDNNTTSESKSIHDSSRFVREYQDSFTVPQEISVVPELEGTENSFIQIRVDSKVSRLVIDDLFIEYVD